MKILFAIQGTGNGHLSRAGDVYPELCRHGEVDVLISGIQADIKVPFPVKYKLYGLSFIFGNRGGIDLRTTVRKLRLLRLLRDIRRLPLRRYDLVVNDFEPVSAWACRLQGKRCISLSHQWAVLHPQAPQPADRDRRALAVLKHYAPCSDGYGFHFKSYGPKIFTPVIRREVRGLPISDEGHITVYLPAYDDATLLPFLQGFADARWQVFSKHCKAEAVQGNVHIRPIENGAFLNSMAACHGVLCGGGFEGPAEALYLGKKLMVIPMQNQYEQQCNAAALATLGVPVLKKLSTEHDGQIHSWLSGAGAAVTVDYPDQTARIVDELVADFLRDGSAGRKQA